MIVVGGGPAGSATAWGLARLGVDVLVLDRARFPRDKTCGEYLSPQASRILADMGALGTVEAAGAAQLAGMVVRAPSGARIHGEFAADHGFRGFRDRGLALRRHALDAILLDAARDAGARVAADVRVADLERDGYVGIADVGNGETNVAVVVPSSRVRRLRPVHGSPEAFAAEWIARRPHLAPRFAAAERLTPVRVTGPFAAHARRAWAPGAALVGDAADFFDPFTGEGIYAALRGGELLAPYARAACEARNGRAASSPLRAYDAARRREFAGKWLVEKLIGGAVGSPALMNHAARVLERRRDMADLLVGVAGDFVPPSEVLRPGYVLGLVFGPLFNGVFNGERSASSGGRPVDSAPPHGLGSQRHEHTGSAHGPDPDLTHLVADR